LERITILYLIIFRVNIFYYSVGADIYLGEPARGSRTPGPIVGIVEEQRKEGIGGGKGGEKKKRLPPSLIL
jgi:hypothetical protein